MEKIYDLSEDLSGAEIKSVVTEAGYCAIRADRNIVKEEDFIHAIQKIRKKEDQYGKDYVSMFG